MREVEGYAFKCKYCSNVYLDSDDLAQHESATHNDDLSDYELIDGQFSLKWSKK